MSTSRFTKGVLGALAFTALAAVAASARADEVAVRETVYVGPNRPLLWSGIFTAGVPYVASVAVGAESQYNPDRALFIPFAGPWVDLAQRGGCPVAASSCNTETLNKVLLVGDGIFQGIGALTILSSFLLPERGGRHLRAENKPELHFAPIHFAQGGGLQALGTF